MIRFALSRLFFAGLIPSILLAYSGGPPDGYSGAPGEETCQLCHASYGLNAGPGSLTISGPVVYEPGQTYPITVTLEHPGQACWGFQFSPLDQGSCTITDPVNTQLSVSNSRSYVSHTLAGTQAGSFGPVSWTFDWTAPTDGAATIVFYASGNASDHNGSPTGDYIYTATHTVGIVPVELLGFGALVEDGAVVLSWTTLSERDNLGFRLFRSCGDQTTCIAALIPGAGTSSVPRSYRFVDRDVSPGSSYLYELSEVSTSSLVTPCARARVVVKSPCLTVTPRVVNGDVRLLIDAPGYHRLEILDLAGRVVAEASGQNPWTYDLLGSHGRRLSPSAYVCRARAPDGVASTLFVVLK